jgi:Tol biopolymer transport system component
MAAMCQFCLSPAPAGADGLPLQATRSVSFATDEGTWISIDVSPDGRSVVFDLLGDLYLLPIEGGKARALSRGIAFDTQPRFSPDGRRIAFVSDRDGSENVWLMDVDGDGQPQRLTQGEDTVFVSPEWTPDGKGIVVSRTGVVRNSLMELLYYPLAGDAPTSLVNGEVHGLTALGAAFGRHASRVYFAQKPKEQQNYFPQIGQYQLAALDRDSGEIHPITNTQGGGLRPVLSPDGRWLVYASRFHAGTGLRLRDLSDGTERWLIHPVESDDQTAQHASWDLMPGASFTPDSQALVTTLGGKLWKLTVPAGARSPIPFSVDVDQPLGPAIRGDRRLADGPVQARRISSPALSPDGRRVAFSALGRIWVMNLPGGSPRRLTDAEYGEFQPAWSADGREIVYASWESMAAGGHVYRVDAQGRRERLTKVGAFYGWPTYSPDGQRIAVTVMSRQAWIDDLLTYGEDLSPRGGQRAELAWIPAEGGDLRRVMALHGLSRPQFTTDPERIFVLQGPERGSLGQGGLVSVRLDGSEPRVHATGQLHSDDWPDPGRGAPISPPIVSPDGRHLLVQSERQIYLVDLPDTRAGPAEVSLDTPRPGSSVQRISNAGGEFAAWSQDGRDAVFSLGSSVFRYNLDSKALLETPVRIEWPRQVPESEIVLGGARVITMRGDEVLPGADILIRRNRIAAVGAPGTLDVPAGAKRLDLAGKTVVPGFLDLHNHQGTAQEARLIQPWEFVSSLAYGVTTGYDTGAAGASLVDYADLVETGQFVGPRFLGTGGILLPGNVDELRSIDDARDLLRRYVTAYGLDGVKEYAFGGRRKRQLLMMAAAEAGVPAHTEGNGENKPGITEIIDGYTTHQHYFTIAPLYRDVVELIARSGAGYVPTLLIEHGAQGAEEYYYPRMPVHDDPKLARFTPHPFLDRQTRRREDVWLQWLHDEEWPFPRFAKSAGEVIRAGGKVGVGAHGQRQGIGFHWEMWNLATGMSNHDVLRAATVLGARIIGLEQDLGTIEPGKMADLVVLDADPLADIRNSAAIRYVVKNGVVYSGDTLSEVLPEPRARDWLQGWQEDPPSP